ncbi:putative riboflavin biosynthesis protein Rib7 [Myriangium duriaei CBS 260.36]|uniref:2,5-diamino-6-ribosylamino-4(3H)-pyrimidinone 5'-phosphate reductase n=1 Tax=Myriangium duriaei CBS 260.36 TaxID=1168546 RepID=A0A9P4MLG7_9PEZI|nr:putative riboflavin biosynthesis protein Rib7 [Myriangium duriaei CBS 260.36]
MPPRETLLFSDSEREWLEPFLPSTRAAIEASPTRPHVTLTFATSLDSALSIAPGVQTALSGPESKAMTHYLRSRHDAILVGAGTAVADDPSLNCRLDGTGGYGGAELNGQPQPVIVDPSCRWKVRAESKVVRLAKEGRGRAPWVITVARDPPLACVEALREAGGEYLVLPSNTMEGKEVIDWNELLAELWRRGVKSIMIEGGGTVINSLLSSKCAGLVDSVIVTIAPTWLGPGGVVVSPPRAGVVANQQLPVARLQRPRWHQLGDDVVLCGVLK